MSLATLETMDEDQPQVTPSIETIMTMTGMDTEASLMDLTEVKKLAIVRINGMVERLQLSQQMRKTVICLIQHLLIQHISLFFNRHIDQIILCCFYGVAKISQMNLTFREIIMNYRKQQHCNPQVFRRVFVESNRQGRIGPDYVDIITFYNEVFVPVVRPSLVKLGPVKNGRVVVVESKNMHEGQSPRSPNVSEFPSVLDMSALNLSSSQYVYVTPPRDSKMDTCVGESTDACQSPLKDLSATNNCLNDK